MAPVQVAFPEAYRFLFERHRYKGGRSGRGAAKSWSFARALLLLGTGSVPGWPDPLRILGTRETQKSIEASVYTLLADQIKELGLQDLYEIQSQQILGKNGTNFIFAGLKQLTIDNIKSLEGVDIAWVEEAQFVSKPSLEILIPTIRKERSELWFSWNPELETDEIEVQSRAWQEDPNIDACIVTTSWRDNPWFPETLRIEKDHLQHKDPDAYRHVWEGECRSAVQGAIYGAEMQLATAQGRITHVPVDRTKPVDTFWDLGFGDKTAIWFAQAVDGWYNIVDYLEDSGHTIEWYLIQLQNKGYLYGNDWLPHDSVDAIIHRRLGGFSERSIEMLLREAGRSVRIVPKLPVTDGINAARTILAQCRFDESACYEGLRCLRSYQWGPPAANGVAKREPLHDWASHGADAFRGLALSIKQPRKEPVFVPKRPSKILSAWS